MHTPFFNKVILFPLDVRLRTVICFKAVVHIWLRLFRRLYTQLENSGAVGEWGVVDGGWKRELELAGSQMVVVEQC